MRAHPTATHTTCLSACNLCMQPLHAILWLAAAFIVPTPHAGVLLPAQPLIHRTLDSPRCRVLGAAAIAARPLGVVHFAHSDLSALPLFEEAVYWGQRVGAEVALAL